MHWIDPDVLPETVVRAIGAPNEKPRPVAGKAHKRKHPKPPKQPHGPR